MRKKAPVFIGVSVIALFVGVVCVVVYTKLMPTVSNTQQLSQIVAIETSLLKKWQQSGALTHESSYGDQGDNVVLLQKMLAQDPALFPKERVTGYYGDVTYEAVTRFQREYKLPVTGVVDEQTKTKLNEIFLDRLCPQESSFAGSEYLMYSVTKKVTLPLEYVPPNLIEISDHVRTFGVACLRSDILSYVENMFRAATNDGVVLMITSGYRSPDIQSYLYRFWHLVEGLPASYEVAEPGKSEHQLGSSIDVTDASIAYEGVSDRFAISVGGLWMQKNAHKFGFTMSYPKHKEKITGYHYEPWHWRFVGVEVATKLKEKNLTYGELDFQELELNK